MNFNDTKEMFIFKINHTGRAQFISEKQYADLFGMHAVQQLLNDYSPHARNWLDVCRASGMDLQMPEGTQRYVAHMHDILQTTEPVDFSTDPTAVELLKQPIVRFVQLHGRYPTVQEAMNSPDFPDVRHYFETFGSFTHACNSTKSASPKSLDVEEIKMLVRYFNHKQGYGNVLMPLSKWDEMVRESGKPIPSSRQLKEHAPVSLIDNSERYRRTVDADRIANSWQGVAALAGLGCMLRGRPRITDNLHDQKFTICKYANACSRSGKVLSYEEWVQFCRQDTRYDYRPPSIQSINKNFGSFEQLRDRALRAMIRHEKLMERFQKRALEYGYSPQQIYDIISSMDQVAVAYEHSITPSR